jgi:hypothetical protein
MNKPITVDVVYTGAKPRKDRSFNLGIDSGELSGETLAALHQFYMVGCKMTLSDDGQSGEAPEYKPTNPAQSKSPSKALRDELWAYFSEAGLEGSFDSYYEQVMKAYLQHWHAKRLGIEK